MASNRLQGDPQNRVICPNCRANNFAGQARCWQCQAALSGASGASPMVHRSASLPTQAAAPAPLPQFVPAGAAQRSSLARPSALLLIGVAMLTFVIVLMLNTRPPAGTAPNTRPTPSGINAGQTATNPASDLNSGQANDAAQPGGPETSSGLSGADAGSGLSSTSNADNGGTASPTSGNRDLLEDAAKRVITRETPNVGLPPAGAVSPDGQVHLRSGGSISIEEWNAAKRKLQDNPLLKEPPAPPPF